MVGDHLFSRSKIDVGAVWDHLAKHLYVFHSRKHNPPTNECLTISRKLDYWELSEPGLKDQRVAVDVKVER